MNDVFTDGLRCALRPIRRQCGRWVAIAWLMSAGGCASTPMLNSELFNALTPTNQVLTAGTTWRVTAIDGRAVSSANAPTMRVSRVDRLTGNTPCNAFVADLSGDGDAVQVAQPALTRRHCGHQAAALETQFLAALTAAVATVDNGDASITLRDGDNRERLRLAPFS